MNEVQRYKFCEIKGSMVGSADGEWCHASHIDDDQSELTTWKTKACEAAEREAALREELTRVKQQSALRLIGLATCGMNREATELRLAAAEQRNAILFDLLDTMDKARWSYPLPKAFQAQINAALKTTESGASE